MTIMRREDLEKGVEALLYPVTQAFVFGIKRNRLRHRRLQFQAL